MKNGVVLIKIHVTMKPYLSTHHFSPFFSLIMNRKKRVPMRAMRKILNIFILQLPISYILE